MISIKFQKHTHNKSKNIYNIIVISNKMKPSSGKFIEKIGHYNPLINKWSNKNLFIDMDRLFYWLKRGVKLNKSLYILIKPMIIYLLNNKKYDI